LPRTGEESERIQGFIRGKSTLPEVEITGRIKVFISYADKPENNYLVEDLIRNFLMRLGFEPLTFRDARSSVPLKTEIDRLIEESPALIAFLTKDIPEHGTAFFHPKANIPGEIERALTLGHKVILFFEEGATLPSNIKSYYCHPFINKPERYAKLFMDLIGALGKERLLRLS